MALICSILNLTGGFILQHVSLKKLDLLSTKPRATLTILLTVLYKLPHERMADVKTNSFITLSDQYQYLDNCPPNPPLTQQQSIDNKLRLMLGWGRGKWAVAQILIMIHVTNAVLLRLFFQNLKLLGKTTHSKRNRVLNKQAPMKKNSSITYPQTKNK